MVCGFLVDEPAAAAIAYKLNKKGSNVMGHGGGTFDISLLSIDDCVSWRSWIPLVIRVLLSAGGSGA